MNFDPDYDTSRYEGLTETGRIEKGKAVVVFKGRKVAKGTKGVVRWVGSNQWGYSVGLEVEGNEKLIFTSLDNVKLDDSPEAKLAEIDAAHATAIWIEAQKAATRVNAAGLATVTVAKGDRVTPKSGAYANRPCRVIWVGAKAEGIKVGVVPVTKPRIVGGRAVFASYNADWLLVDQVA